MMSNVSDSPTVIIPTLPPGTSPLRRDAIWRAILAEWQRQHQDREQALPGAMHRLFMTTMQFFHRHSHVPMSVDLRSTLSAMQRAIHDDQASRWALTTIAIDLIERTPAIHDSEVWQALWQARNIVQPVL